MLLISLGWVSTHIYINFLLIKFMFLSLAGGAENVPLTTAETILLVYFKKGYTKEIKRDKHLLPLCRDLKMKHFKSKDKNDLIMAVAKQLLLNKTVVLQPNADFYCLHRDSITVNLK